MPMTATYYDEEDGLENLSVQVADHIVHSLSDRWIIGQRLTAEAGGGLEGQLLR